MLNFLLIFLGAGLGGMLRFAVWRGVHTFLGIHFPYGTLIVNVTGSFCMGLLYILFLNRYPDSGLAIRSFFLIGLLGGYTTFSSFAIETLLLLENGTWLSAFLNIFLSLLLCMVAVWLGVFVGGRRL